MTASDIPSDYEPLDLSACRNARSEASPDGVVPPTGRIMLRGIPFQMAEPGDPTVFVRLGAGGHSDRVRIEFPNPARSVIVAHVLLDSDIPHGGPIGLRVADAVFDLDDGSAVTIPIRESFEIAVAPRPQPSVESTRTREIAAVAFDAVPDSVDGMAPRWSGPWALAGERLTELQRGQPDLYRLWVWRVPHGRRATGLAIRGTRRPFLIGAITIGHLDEDPFTRTAREPIAITLLDSAAGSGPEDLETLVDRGVSTYTWPALPSSDRTFLDDPVRGWGQPRPASAVTFYAEVAASPSATVTVRKAGTTLVSIRWGDLIERGTIERPGARVEWVDRSREWVHTTVRDRGTGRPVPCRIHFRSPAGVPWQPHGHHNHVNSDLSSWNLDIGGDVRLGAMSYAVIDGHCQGWLPVGNVLVEVVRGFEYEPLRAEVQIAPGQRELTLEIERWTDERIAGWRSGDTHVHFLSTPGGHAEAAAEDLHVVNLLQAQWGHLFTSTEEFTGRPSISSDGETIVHVGQENRQHILGHLGLLGLRRPVMPWSSGGPGEAELGGSLETTLSDWADAGRSYGALVTIPHFGYRSGEAAVLIATSRVDAIEMTWLGEYFHREYYRYLNAGFRLPLVGGTDKMWSEIPVGMYRTYVRLEPDEAFTYDAWAQAIRLGRTYLSAGPLLRLAVEGAGIGDTLQMPSGGGTVFVDASAASAVPFESLQVVVDGRVVAESLHESGSRHLEIREQIRVPGDSWIAIRAGGAEYYNARKALDNLGRRIFAHSSPVYIRSGPGGDRTTDDQILDYLLTRVQAGKAYVTSTATIQRLGGGGHPHGDLDHLAHLVRPFDEARARLEARRRAPRPPT